MSIGQENIHNKVGWRAEQGNAQNHLHKAIANPQQPTLAINDLNPRSGFFSGVGDGPVDTVWFWLWV